MLIKKQFKISELFFFLFNVNLIFPQAPSQVPHNDQSLSY